MLGDSIKKQSPPEEEEKRDTFAYKYTICERCKHPKCSDAGHRNIFHGYDEESCVQFTVDGKTNPFRTPHHHESDEVEYSTHHDPYHRKKIGV